MQIRTDELVAVYDWSPKILILRTEDHTFVLTKLVLRIKRCIFIPNDGLALFSTRYIVRKYFQEKCGFYCFFESKVKQNKGK